MTQIQLDPGQESEASSKLDLIFALELKRHKNSISTETMAFLIWPFAFFIALLLPTVVIIGTVTGLFHIENQLTETLIGTFFISGICMLVGTYYFRFSKACTVRVNESHKNLLEDTKLGTKKPTGRESSVTPRVLNKAGQQEILRPYADGLRPLKSDAAQNEDAAMHDLLSSDYREMKALRAEGDANGEMRVLKNTIIIIISERFPGLVELAQSKVEEINEASVLNLMVKQIITAPDESTVRWLLGSLKM